MGRPITIQSGANEVTPKYFCDCVHPERIEGAQLRLRHPELVEGSARTGLLGDLIGGIRAFERIRLESLMRVTRTYRWEGLGGPTSVRGSCIAADVVRESRVKQLLAEGYGGVIYTSDGGWTRSGSPTAQRLFMPTPCQPRIERRGRGRHQRPRRLLKGR